VLELRAFRGHVVAAERAHRVVAPPYDALAPATRAALAATDPDSYLGALPPGVAVGSRELETTLVRCRDHLARLFAAGYYRALPGPTIGVLALGAGDERAVGIVGDVPVAAFAAVGRGAARPGTAAPFRDDDGLVRPHAVVGVASSPVALTQRPSAAVTSATEAVTTSAPDLAYRADDGVDVALWCVTDPRRRRALERAVAEAGPAFLADGHHRSAAAANRDAAALRW